MRKTFLISIFICMSALAFAQKPAENDKSKNTKPSVARFFLGTGTGFNNQSGIIGLKLELPVATNVSIGTGIGASTWGNKVYLEARYYFNPGYKGWAIGAGITNSSGFDNMKASLSTVYYGTTDVTLSGNSITNFFVAGYRVWKLGRNRNRFYIEAGYSNRLNAATYNVTSGQTLTTDADKTVKVLAPGGLIAAVGFSFAL